MELNDLVYKRNFTYLGVFQDAKELTYSLVTSNVETENYGVCVAEHSANEVRTQTIKNLTSVRKTAEDLLRFLYENAITPDVLLDIIHDLKAQGVLKCNTAEVMR